MARPKKSLSDVWDQVDKSSDCWKWHGSHESHGYPIFRVNLRSYNVVTLLAELCGVTFTSHQYCPADTCEPGCVNPHHRVPRSEFYQRWGVTREEFADSENTTPANIIMRVTKYGTPYQRHNKPTNFQRDTGRSLWEVATQMNVNTQTIGQRHSQFGDIFKCGKSYNKAEYWTPGDKIPMRAKFWLHPLHPDYESERAKWPVYVKHLESLHNNLPAWVYEI